MTSPEDPALISVGVQALKDNAQRLGLTWQLTMATIQTAGNSPIIIMDGDSTTFINAISMIGNPPAGSRVYVLLIPPGGIYLVGLVGAPFPKRVATTTRVASVGPFTAETELDAVTATLVKGKTYRIVWYGRLFSSVADGIARFRIREDSTSGTVLAITQLFTGTTLNQSFPVYIEVEYTSTNTEEKTFVTTAIRQAGTGNLTAQAAADAVTYMYLEYV